MNNNDGWKILVAACVLGLFGDLLLRATPWGVNLSLWVVLLALFIFLLKRNTHDVWQGEGRWMFLPALLFPICLVWRDSTTLLMLNLMAATGSLTFALFRARSGGIQTMSLLESVVAACLFMINLVAGLLLLCIENLHWNAVSSHRQKDLSALLRGSLMAVPPLLIFGGLFIAADAAFEGIVSKILHWFFNNIFSHIFLTGLFLWISCGILRQLFLAKQWTPSQENDISFLAIGPIETTVLLGMLNLLFLSFVVIQIRYFFGGAELVETSSTMTYADYARRGFFELVAVSGLLLPLLLGTHWLVRKGEHSQQGVFRILAGTLILLLFVIMVSALQRMRLYQQEYGLTELRFYTTAFMGWLAILFLWFVATVMRGKRSLFVSGAILSGMGIMVVLNIVNPDAWIVRTNTARLQEGKLFDASYAASLSADAVPVLLENLQQMSSKDRTTVACELLVRWNLNASHDWRTWNCSRYNAIRNVTSIFTGIRQMLAGACPQAQVSNHP
jgi:Domain of unknown function (DUF4153)